MMGLKGKRQSGCLTSAERRTRITVELCSAGEFVPQLIIFPRVHTKAELDHCFHKSGRMQSDIFGEWFHHFVKHTNPTADHPVWLILDGDSTHTKSLTLVELARTNHVIITCLPHIGSSHLTCPS